MNLPTLVTVASLVTTLGGAGWYAREKLATKDDVGEVKELVMIADSKGSIALDRQMEALIKAINRLEEKPNKTAEDLAQLRYWREQLKDLRKARAGK